MRKMDGNQKDVLLEERWSPSPMAIRNNRKAACAWPLKSPVYFLNENIHINICLAVSIDICNILVYPSR